jgi:hypothetical protein
VIGNTTEQLYNCLDSEVKLFSNQDEIASIQMRNGKTLTKTPVQPINMWLINLFFLLSLKILQSKNYQKMHNAFTQSFHLKLPGK